MLGPQVGDFLCAGASVVEEQDQGAVPQRERAAAGQVVQEVFDRRGALTVWIPLVDCPAAKGSMRFLTASHHAARWDASADAPTAPSERRTSSIRTPK